MTRVWLTKNEWWLHWAIKLLIPLALFFGALFGNYIVTYYGIETKIHAAELYAKKTDLDEEKKSQEKLNDEFKRTIVALNIRQQVNRKCIVTLNQKHGIETPDYPLEEK